MNQSRKFLSVLGLVACATLFAEVRFDCKCVAQNECYILPEDVRLSLADNGRLRIYKTGRQYVDAQQTSVYQDIDRNGRIFMNHAEFNVLKQNFDFRDGNTMVLKDLLVMKRLTEEGTGYVKLHGIYVPEDASPITTEPFYDSLECKKAEAPQ